MTVPAYQIQNILTLYCRKLEQSWHHTDDQEASIPWKINVIAQSKKESVINKVTESIITKITRMGPRQYMELHAREDGPFPAVSAVQMSREGSHPFSFTVLKKGNVRTRKTIVLGNAEE